MKFQQINTTLNFSKDFTNVWSENNWSEFGKQFNKFKKFPLPGQTGVTGLTEKKLKNFNDLNLESSNGNLVCENLDYLLNQPLNQQSQVLKLNEATAGLVLSEKMEKNAHKSEPIFELKAHDCPKSLLKGNLK